MKRTTTHGWKKLVVLLFASGCVAAWAAGQVRGLRDKAMVTNMLGQKQTVCVVRFLVGLPTAAEFSLSGERIAGFAIDTVEESEGAFAERLAARVAEIRARDATDDRTGEGGMINAHSIPVPGLVGRSFIYGRSRGYLMDGERRIDMESVSVESHAHLKGLSFTLSATSVQEDCVKDAEWIVLHVGLPGHPDMGLAFDSLSGGRTDSTLLERIAHTDAEAGITSSIRRRKADVFPNVHESKPSTFSSWYCLQSDNTRCASGEVMFDTRRSDDGTAFKWQSTWSLPSSSIATLVSMLP